MSIRYKHRVKTCGPRKWRLNERVAGVSCFLMCTGSGHEPLGHASVLTLLLRFKGHIPVTFNGNHLRHVLVQALSLKKKRMVLLQTTPQLKN